MLAGMPLKARSVSSTVTLNVWLTALGVSSASVAVHVTVVVPMGNVEPDAGEQATVAAGLSPASSTAEGIVYLTTAPFGLVALIVMSVGTPLRARSVSVVPSSHVSL